MPEFAEPEFVETASDDPVAAGMLDDYFASRELGFTTHPGGYRVVHPDPARFTPPAGAFFVLRDDAGAAVGCGGVRRIDDRDGEACFEVKHVWIDPSARGRGWSRLLTDRLETRALELGARWIVLATNESLRVAQHLYTSGGYSAVPPYNDNPNATHWFAKRVAAPK